MKKFIIVISIATLGILLFATSNVYAHGQPVITVQPQVAGAGSQIIVMGSEMEAGEIFSVSLEGIGGSIPLGEATVIAEGDEGGFEMPLNIPENTQPGSYFVRAVTDEGEKAEVDLTVTLPTSQASASSAVVQEPTGALHQLDRSKPLGEMIGAAVVALVSSLLGLWFVIIRK